MRKLAIIFLAGASLQIATARGADLKESKFTQVVNDVQVVSTSDNSKHPAVVDALFKLPDVVRTGPASRAELVADDRTITRIGANTIFSFDQASRTIKLDQGSLLFNSPKGKGGGSIHTTAATAAVLGTTIIVTTTPDGGFKVLVLEGKAEVQFLNHARRSLKAGQMVFVLPGSLPGPVVVFRLDQQVAGSQLVNGFSSLLPTLPLINQEVTRQLNLIRNGREVDTGLLVGNVATPTSVQTIQLFNEINASPGASNGLVSGLTTNGAVPGGGGGFTLPPGFVVPNGLTFEPGTGGFLTSAGLLFIATTGTNGTTAAPSSLTNAAVPALASLSDSTITSVSTMDPAHFFFNPFLGIDTISGRSVSASAGYIANNLTFNNAFLNLAPFSSQTVFAFLAAGIMTFDGGNTITQSPQFLQFTARNGFVFPMMDSSLTSDAQFLNFYSPGSLTLDSANITDNGIAGNEIIIDSTGSSLIMNNSFVTGGSIFFSAPGPITIGTSSFNTTSTTSTTTTSPGVVAITSPSSIAVSDTFVSSGGVAISSSGSTVSVTGSTASTGGLTGTQGVTVLAATGTTIGVNITATAPVGQSSPASLGIQNSAGMLTVNNGAHFIADTMTVNSPGGMLFDTTTVTANTSATFTAGNAAGNTITMQNTSFNGLGNVSIAANTQVYTSVNFGQGPTYTLTSANHALAANPNTGAAVVPGDVNFITAVTYGSQQLPAQNFTGGVGSGQPIIIK